MSILNSIIFDYELKQLAEELRNYELTIRELKVQLSEAPMDFASQENDEWVIFDEATKRLQIAKKALGLANRHSRPEERSHHKKVVIGILNRLKALVHRLTVKLTSEVRDIHENWQDTAWENDTTKVSIKEVLSFFKKQPTKEIDPNKLKSVAIKPESKERMLKADLSYAILILKTPKGIRILDGNHRLAKALHTGEKRVKARILDIKDLPEKWHGLFS